MSVCVCVCVLVVVVCCVLRVVCRLVSYGWRLLIVAFCLAVLCFVACWSVVGVSCLLAADVCRVPRAACCVLVVVPVLCSRRIVCCLVLCVVCLPVCLLTGASCWLVVVCCALCVGCWLFVCARCFLPVAV